MLLNRQELLQARASELYSQREDYYLPVNDTESVQGSDKRSYRRVHQRKSQSFGSLSLRFNLTLNHYLRYMRASTCCVSVKRTVLFQSKIGLHLRKPWAPLSLLRERHESLLSCMRVPHASCACSRGQLTCCLL
jgi:hypothetical protein